MDKRERKGLALGAVIGAVAGVVTGILFAPKSGKETRKDIKDAAVKASDTVQDEAKKLQAEAVELLDKLEAVAKDKTGKVSDSAKTHAKDLKEKASDLAEIAKSFKAGKSTDKDLNDAIKQVKAAKASIKTFLSHN